MALSKQIDPVYQMLTRDALVRVIESEIFGARGAILLVDDSTETLAVAAAPSGIDLDLGWHEADRWPAGPEAGTAGTAAYWGEVVITTDVARDPLWSESRQSAEARGIRAAWSMPIIAAHGGRVLGVLAVYFDEPCQPEPADMQLLELAAQLADIAIDRGRS